MPSVLHTIRRMTRDDPARASGAGSSSARHASAPSGLEPKASRRHGWAGPPSALARAPTALLRSPSGCPPQCAHEGEREFFGTPRIASSCRCRGCWRTPPLVPLVPATVAVAERDRKPLPFLPTRRKPPPPLTFAELDRVRAPYPSPPPEPDPAEGSDALDDAGPEPGAPPVPAKDLVSAEEVQAVRAHYAPVSADELKSLYDEIWTAASDLESAHELSVVDDSVSFPPPRAAPLPPSASATPPTPAKDCSSCSACSLRARRSQSAQSLGRSPRRRPVPSNYRASGPVVAQPAEGEERRTSSKRLCRPEAAARSPKRPTGPRPIV